MSQDEQNLNLLGILHYVLGGITIAGSSMFLFHIGMGLSMMHGAGWLAGDKGPPPWDFGVVEDVPGQSPYSTERH